MPETVHGTRAVGDTALRIEEEEGLGPAVVLYGIGFLGCDTFRIPAPGHPSLPPVGTELRVDDRGWWLCSCCGTVQPHLRGGGVGAIECHASGRFHLYVVAPGTPPLLPERPAE